MIPVTSLNSILGREPGAAHAGDVFAGQELRRRLDGNATGRAESDVAQGTRNGVEHAHATGWHSREQFQLLEALLARGHHLGRCHHTGQQCQTTRFGSRNQSRREPRRDAKHGACVARSGKFLRRGQGAHANDGALHGRHGADRLEAMGSTQSHFQHPDAARDQGARQRHGMGRIVDGNDRDDARNAHDF